MKNVQLLRNVDPHLADAVENLAPKKWRHEKENLLNLETGEYLHNPEGPLKEAERWASTIKLNAVNTLFVYGIGLGYYYEPLKEWLKNPNNFLIFIEDDLEVIYHFLQEDRANEILSNPKVRIMFLGDKKRFEDLMLQFAFNPYQVSGLMAYIKRKVDQLLRLNKSIEYMISTHKWLQSEFDNLGAPFYRNFYANLLKLPESKSASSLFGKFKGIPAIVVGAGPSLKKNVHELERLKDKALIIAGSTAVNALNAAGINPHLGVGVDPNEDQAFRVLTNTAFMVPYIYHSRLYHSALNLLHGDLYYQNTKNGYPVSYWMEEKLGVPSKPIEGGYNVVNLSFDIAYALGCSPIITVGVDLAYSDGDSYAPILSSHPLAEGSFKFITKRETEELIPRVDINGKPVLTLWKWMMEAVWYSKFLVNHPDCVLINATEGGIGFPGVPNMTLKEVEEAFLKDSYDFEALIHAIGVQANMPESVSIQSIRNTLKEAEASLKKVKEITGKIHKEFVRLSQEDNPKSFTKEIIDSLAKLEKEEAYSAFIEFLNKRYNTLIQKEINSLEINKGVLSEGEIAAGKAKLQAARYELLSKAAALNLEYVQKTLAFLDSKSDVKREKASETQALVKSSKGKKEYFFQDGTLSFSGNYKEGKPDQEHVYYYLGGKVRAKIPYDNGKLNGKVALYYPNGTLKRMITYKQGLREGEEGLYTESGSRIIEAHYQNDKPVGVQRYFSPNGDILKEITYENGDVRILVASKNGLIPFDPKKSADYFDSVTIQTENLTKSLSQLFISMKNFLLEIRKDTEFLKGHENLIIMMNEGILQVGKELEQLTHHSQELLKESRMGLKEDREAIWKTPATKKLLDAQVTILLETVRKGIEAIRAGFNQVLDAYVDFHKK